MLLSLWKCLFFYICQDFKMLYSLSQLLFKNHFQFVSVNMLLLMFCQREANWLLFNMLCIPKVCWKTPITPLSCFTFCFAVEIHNIVHLPRKEAFKSSLKKYPPSPNKSCNIQLQIYWWCNCLWLTIDGDTVMIYHFIQTLYFCITDIYALNTVERPFVRALINCI